ncbi:DUF1353 domain-containing protein [Pseudomonas luteola]|uniref:DUF1353 domain-containing protein n=1 Tax=Pseudomonas luteola TaxID=47886 RepID=UPI00123A3822|nr:DUF1353 domain-containing protein [Pseudomonas luteola]QEU28929.1 DUF1353 domain-containing protein [Pseudomonas luteola]
MKWLEPDIYERGRFANHLIAEQASRWEWQLTSPLIYKDPVFGSVTVPTGFQTNFASIRSLRIIASPIYGTLVGYGNAACTVHDYLYGGGKTERGEVLSREEADGVLYRALRAEGVARWRASLFYIGVRLGGKGYYKTPTSSGFSSSG